MTLLVNGESLDYPGDNDLLSLLAHLHLPSAAVLIEHNGDALRREEWNARRLQDSDSLEIIRIVAGG